jgi:hypothetical protein
MNEIVLRTQDLRAVTRYAAECARAVLEVFERAHPDDPRPRAAIEAAQAFAEGGERGKTLRDTAWAALQAAQNSSTTCASQAARAAMAAAGAAYLHPLANATQVKHILGSAAHAARALECAAGDDPEVGAAHIAHAAERASLEVIAVLERYPPAPPGGGRVGALMRALDAMLRER